MKTTDWLLPWRARQVIPDLETQVMILQRDREGLMVRLETCQNQANQHQANAQKHKDNLRKLFKFVKATAASLLMLIAPSVFGQPILRNTATTNNPPLIAGSGIFGTITAQVANYSDLAKFVDTNTLALGVIAWAYDGRRITIGDGITLGGWPMGVRYWPVYTNIYSPGLRPGEIIVTAATNLSPTLYLNALKTNPIPIVTASGDLGTNIFGTHAPFFKVNYGTNGNNSDFFSQGIPGGIPGAGISIGVGNGGNALTVGFAANGGNLAAIQVLGGNGGNGTTANGNGGNGGQSGFFDLNGGNGGNDGSVAGNGGGPGGLGGGISLIGGIGSDATVGASGSAGGSAGNINLSGADSPLAANPGGFGGGITAIGVSSNSAGGLILSATATRNGGSLTSFGNTFVPVVLFTTTSTVGPTNTAVETSLLGSLASFTGGSALIPSNTVDHIGRTIRFHAEGEIWDTAVIPTLDIKLKVGSAIVLDTGAIAPVALTGPMEWSFDGTFTFRTLGTSGTGFGQCRFTYNSTTSQVQAISTAANATVTVNTANDQTVDCTATWGAATVGNSIKCTGAYFELIN